MEVLAGHKEMSMNPNEIKLRLYPLKNGEKRVSYSREEAIPMIHELGGRMILSQFKSMEEARAIPPSIFFRGAHFFTFCQIHILADWFSGRLVAAGINPRAYAYAHWHEPDEIG
jgi:hypothetical protein